MPSAIGTQLQPLHVALWGRGLPVPECRHFFSSKQKRHKYSSTFQYRFGRYSYRIGKSRQSIHWSDEVRYHWPKNGYESRRSGKHSITYLKLRFQHKSNDQCRAPSCAVVLHWGHLPSTYACRGQWTSTLPIIQAAGFIDLHWHKRTRGLRLFRHQKQYTLWMNALSGIYYNTVGLEYAVSNNDGFAVRVQVFTDYGTFLDHEPLPNFQWLGGIYKHSFREVVLKAGAGLGVKDITSDI